VSSPEIAFTAQLTGFVQKVWVRRVGICDPVENEAVWMEDWEEQPPHLPPPA